MYADTRPAREGTALRKTAQQRKWVLSRATQAVVRDVIKRQGLRRGDENSFSAM